MTSYLWDYKTLVNALPYAKVGKEACGNFIAIDSRQNLEGAIFAAFRGEQTDGHLYIEDALTKGATGIIAERLPSRVSSDKIILVPDVAKAITELAIYNRGRTKAKIIGVTGSVGKTSTKEALNFVFSAYGKTYCTKGNFNNLLGLPITLASQPLDAEYAIYEMGMDSFGEIEKLSKLARPHLSMITAIAPAHIEKLGSLENIVKAKSEIFLGMEDSGIALVNGDIPFSFEYGRVKNILKYGSSKGCDAYIVNLLNSKSSNATSIEAMVMGKMLRYNIGAYGAHHAVNTLGAVMAAAALGLNFEIGARALENYSSYAGRGQVVEVSFNGKDVTIIDDSYNANPASMAAALDASRLVRCKGRKIAILGDMYELGDIAVDAHVKLAEHLQKNNIDKLIAVGPLMKHLFDTIPESMRLAHFDNYSLVKNNLYDLINSGDCLLVKGSHGTKLYEIVNYLKQGNQ